MGLEGKVVVVTGANSGIGKVTARELAKKGAKIVAVCRDEARVQAAVEDIKRDSGSNDVDFMLCDFSKQRWIREFAAAFNGKYGALHVLVNNAGGLVPERQITEDGIELTFAAN